MVGLELAGDRSKVRFQPSDVAVDGHDLLIQRPLLVFEDILGKIAEAGAPVDGDVTAVGFHFSKDHFHDRRFSRSVLADQRDFFTIVDFDVDVFEKEFPGEALLQIGDFEQAHGRSLLSGYEIGCYLRFLRMRNGLRFSFQWYFSLVV